MAFKMANIYFLICLSLLIGCSGKIKKEEPSNIPLDKLAAYWSMDSEDIKNDILKSKVNGIEGKIVNATANENGQVKQSLNFNGNSSYINFGDILDSTFAGSDNSFTITMWVNPSKTKQYATLIAKHGDTSCKNTRNQRQIGIRLTGTSSDNLPTFYYMAPSGRQLAVIQSGTTVQNNAWSHLAIAYNGSIDRSPQDRVQIYVNGQKTNLSVSIKRGGFPFDLQDSTAHLSLGDQVDGKGEQCQGKAKNAFAGSIDEVAIWNGVLNSSQIRKIRQQELSGFSVLKSNNNAP